MEAEAKKIVLESVVRQVSSMKSVALLAESHAGTMSAKGPRNPEGTLNAALKGSLKCLQKSSRQLEKASTDLSMAC